jgi:hypothetical protein
MNAAVVCLMRKSLKLRHSERSEESSLNKKSLRKQSTKPNLKTSGFFA